MLFSKDALQKTIRKEDLEASGNTPEAIAVDALDVVKHGFGTLTLQTIQVRKKIAYCVQSVPHLIVLRRLNFALRTATRVQPSDRDTIIRCLATVLAEGVDHRIYKFDIKSFFESVDTAALYREIAADRCIPRSAALVLSSYLDQITKLGIHGIPRGVPLSATLAEYAMQGFDRYISSLPEVYYFARYVDDIVIITGAREEKIAFARKIRKRLPFNLTFNHLKSEVVDITVQRKSNGRNVLGSFNYLGYNLAIHESANNGDRRLARQVSLNIAPNKVRRLKSRICCALAHFGASNDFELLQQRMQLLTGNYNVRDFTTGAVRNVGLFCNYRRINQDTELVALDAFLRSVAVGNRSWIAKRLASKATREQRKRLLVFSFRESFKAKTFYNFPAHKLADLTGCWRNA